MITVDQLIATLNFCQILAGKTVQHSDLPSLVASDPESLEKNHFHNDTSDSLGQHSVLGSGTT